MDDLIERLKARIADPDKITKKIVVEVVRKKRAHYTKVVARPLPGYPDTKVFTPTTIELLRRVEQELGFALPTFLYAIYTKVTNGGFGPGLRLLGVESNVTPPLLNRNNAVNTYLRMRYEAGMAHEEGISDKPIDYTYWKEGFLPICYNGGYIYFFLDCTVEDGAIFKWDAGKFVEEPVAPSLSAWLENWLAS